MAYAVEVIVNDSHTVPWARLPGVTVLMSLADGTAVDQQVTDVVGSASFSLEVGDYVITLAKEGLVFSENNKAVSVIDPATAEVPETANKFWAEGSYFEPSFDPWELFGAEAYCNLTLILSTLSGQPVRGKDVYIRSVGRPQVLSGVGGAQIGIIDRNLNAVTDSTGRATNNGSGYIRILRNAQVEVAIQGTGVTRRITVPDAAEAEFFALLNAAADVFDVIQRAPLAVPRDDV